MDRDACGRVIGRSRDDSREDDRAPLPSSSSSGRPYRDVLPRGGSSNGNGVGGANGSANGALMGTLACPSVTQWSNTFGLSPQFLESLGISGPLVSRVFVANVSFQPQTFAREKKISAQKGSRFLIVHFGFFIPPFSHSHVVSLLSSPADLSFANKKSSFMSLS